PREVRSRAGGARCARLRSVVAVTTSVRRTMLRIQGVDRSFGDRKVLDDVTFTVERGRLTGFVGGNGAGKTTTMRIILGVLAADRGEVTLDGHPLQPEDRVDFGYMPEERGL